MDELARWRRIKRAETRWVPAEWVMDRVAGLDRFYAAWQGEALAHISWVSLVGQPTSLPGVRVGSAEAEVRAAYTEPVYRGRGLFTATLQSLLWDLSLSGVKVVFAHVRPTNQASLRAFQSAGFTVAGRCFVTCRLGRRWVEYQPLNQSQAEASPKSLRFGDCRIG